MIKWLFQLKTKLVICSHDHIIFLMKNSQKQKNIMVQLSLEILKTTEPHNLTIINFSTSLWLFYSHPGV